MQVLYSRCCGLDLHKRSITGCCLWFNNTQQRQEETRQFGTETAELRRLATWLREHEVKKVVMEATGSYWRPVWNLFEMESFVQTLAKPQHMKALTGRKTDKKDARWSADLFQHGLIAPSFVPTQQMRHLRDLTRTRTKVTQEHTRVVDRIEAVLEDTSIKLSSVVSDIMVVSAQAMLQAFAAWRGTRRNSRELTQGRMRPKVPQLKEALEGNLRPHHEFVRNDCSCNRAFCSNSNGL